MEYLLRPWREDLAAIVARGVEESIVPPDVIDDFTLRFVALLDGLRCSACVSCISCPASASSNWP